MKNKFLLIAILFIVSCHTKKDKQDIKAITTKKTVEIDKSNIDSLNEVFSENEIEYNLVGNIKSDLNGDGKKDEFTVYNYKGWDKSEPGDFRKIEIKTSKKNILKNIDSWVRLSNMKMNKSLLKYKDQNNDYYISLDIGFRNPVIICFGYWYADTPGYISIFSVDMDEPELVFNKPFHVKEVKEDKKSGHKSLIGTFNNNLYGLKVINQKLNFTKI